MEVLNTLLCCSQNACKGVETLHEETNRSMRYFYAYYGKVIDELQDALQSLSNEVKEKDRFNEVLEDACKESTMCYNENLEL